MNGRMPLPVRRALTVLHVVSSVGLLGSAGAVTALVLSDHGDAAPAVVHGLGIPLALTGLLTGVLLAVGTRWGLFKHGWVVAKLLLLLGVLALGVVGVRPALDELQGGAPAAAQDVLLLNGTQLLALVLATVLSVLKPRKLIAVAHTRARRSAA